MCSKIKGVCIGAGYFSHFQYDAWNRIPEVEITAMCNRDKAKAESIMSEYNVPAHYTDYREMLHKEKPDFVDIITPPESHFEMCQFAADEGINIICQKPLAPTFEESCKIVDYVTAKQVRFMVHENWRFQPWYREIKKLIQNRVIGKIHTLVTRKRMGDGWGEDAYLSRQPYFREYPRLIVYENGIHFIDTYRFLAGEIKEVFAKLRKINPVIRGEDWAMVTFDFEDDIIGLWDASRYNEPNYPNPRLTFGELLIDGTEGSVRLYGNGELTIRKLGGKESKHKYDYTTYGFAGDCVFPTQKHFINGLLNNTTFETSGPDYLRSLAVQEAVYRSAEVNEVVKVKYR